MMKSIKKEKNQQGLSVNENIRRARFVPQGEQKSKTFKYFLNFLFVLSPRKTIAHVKRKINSIIQKIGLWIKKVDWEKLRGDVSLWFTEAILEGLTANFVTHYLFGVELNLFTILAHGILIKQGISIWWRLRLNGSDAKIPKKDERLPG